MSVAKWAQYAAGGFSVLVLLSFASGKPEILPDSVVDRLVQERVFGSFSGFNAAGELIEFNRDFGDPGPDILSRKCISLTDRRGGVRGAVPRVFACYALVNYQDEEFLVVFGAQRTFLEDQERIALTSFYEDEMNEYRERFGFPQPGAAPEI